MRPFALLAAACCLLQLQAQELLPNGGFEQFTACPDSAGQIGRASGWSRPTADTSDYFNACQQSIPPGFNVFIPGVPDNYFGHQPAHGGQGYAGFYCSDSVISLPNGNYKEYVSHPLATPMVPGEAYLVEFFVNLSDHSATPTHDIGALFSTEMPHRDDAHPLTELPQITPDASTLLDDSVGWTRIHACFIADSAYAFITIGSFPAAASGLLPEGTTSAAAGAAGMLKDGPTGFPPAAFRPRSRITMAPAKPSNGVVLCGFTPENFWISACRWPVFWPKSKPISSRAGLPASSAPSFLLSTSAFRSPSAGFDAPSFSTLYKAPMAWLSELWMDRAIITVGISPAMARPVAVWLWPKLMASRCINPKLHCASTESKRSLITQSRFIELMRMYPFPALGRSFHRQLAGAGSVPAFLSVNPF